MSDGNSLAEFQAAYAALKEVRACPHCQTLRALYLYGLDELADRHEACKEWTHCGNGCCGPCSHCEMYV